MEAENLDPIDWDVEKIVTFLCNPQDAPWSDSATSSRPDLPALEAALRENEINGEALLHDVNNTALKDDMGIKVLGHRSSVLRAIAWLRARSPKYLAKQNLPLSSTRQSSTEQLLSSVASPVPSSVTSSSVATPVDLPTRIQPMAPEMAPVLVGVKEKRRIAPMQVADAQGRRLGDEFPQTDESLSENRATGLSPRRTVRGNDQTGIAGHERGMLLTLPGHSAANKVTSNDPPPEAFLSEDRSEFLTQKDHEFFDHLLKKYGGDELLPEEDPEYDDEDLHELLEDLPDSSSVEDQESKSTSTLSRAECEKFFSEYVSQYERAWEEKHLPRHQRNAHTVWQLGHDARTGDAYKSDASQSIRKCRSRLESQQNAFIDAGYNSYASLRDVCRIMDTTLDQICLDQWKLETISLDTCPPFVPPPPRAPRPRKSRVTNADEVSLDSESDIPDSDDAADGDAADDEASGDESGSDFEGDIPGQVERTPLAPTPGTFGMMALSTLQSDDSEEEFVTSKRRRLLPSQSSSDLGISGALRLGSSPQAGQNTDSADAMVIATPPLNPTLPATSPRDITMLEENFQVTTPPLNPTHSTQPAMRAQRTVSSIEPLSEDTDYPAARSRARKSPSVAASLGKPVDPSPSMDDIDIFDLVRDMSWDVVESSKDRISLLAKNLTCLPSDELEFFGPYLEQFLDPVYMEEVTGSLQAMLNNKWSLEGRNEEESRAAMRLGAYFVCWHLCKMLTAEGMGKEILQEALEALEDDEDMTMFMAFIHRLKKLHVSYKAWLSRQPERHSAFSESAGSDSNRRKRKRNAAAKVLGARSISNEQKIAQERQAKADKARERLRKSRERQGISNDDPEGQAVTLQDPVIYLHPHIGQSVKPHQLQGIQFMWREVIEADNQQGCLLAHVMGLGKSMQVISLLVTIAAAAASEDPKIRSQVPERLHRSQTLLLCPSSVVPNWLDEFAYWTPLDHHLGPILEISPRGLPPQRERDYRLQTLRKWDKEGGVLIMSYEMLRILIMNKRASLDEQQHEFVKDCLLEGSNIIVADEAHKLRSEKSAISQVASRFKSTSRIALTGSPLSNQLFEYYQMLEWVAPGYLEDPVTFKKKFMDPIQAGSYIDSSKAEQRESLRALQLLNGILAPKVLRADTSVLAADLPPKTEFVLTVPLTELQRNAYDAFVDCARSTGLDAPLRLWSWLAIMQLCCNHPFPFREKLTDRLRQQEDKEGQFEGGQSILPKSIQDAGLPSDMASRMDLLFSKYSNLQDIALSNRAILLDRILELSLQAGDKVLIFTQSIPTMNYLKLMLVQRGRRFLRIDGSTPGPDRQDMTKRFNAPGGESILLISTRAGGVGLNMYGANRVIIFDFLFNPMWEEQAVGRAYRLGQKKPVFVYRFLAGGTFEELIYNNAVFKRQLAVRVVDKKTVVRESSRNYSSYLTHVKDVEKDEQYPALGRDPQVLDRILNSEYNEIVLKANLSHIQDNENDILTAEESRQVEDELKMERLKRADPQGYHAELKRRDDAERARREQAAAHHALQWQRMQQEQQRLLQAAQASQQQAPQQQYAMVQQNTMIQQNIMMPQTATIPRGNFWVNLLIQHGIDPQNVPRHQIETVARKKRAIQALLNHRVELLERWLERSTFLKTSGRVLQAVHRELQENHDSGGQEVQVQQLFASLLPAPVPTSTEGSSAPSVQPQGTSHEQPVPTSAYTPSSSSLRQAGNVEARAAFVVPAGNEVIVIDDDSTYSTPVNAAADRGYSAPASSPMEGQPLSPTPNTTVAAQADAAPASGPVSGRSEPMDLSDSTGSNNVTIDASLYKAAATPGLCSQSEAMDISDGA